MASRSDRLADLLAAPGLDALLVTDLIDVRYLTGFTGSSGLAVVGPDVRVFVTDFRYVEQSAAEVEPQFDRRRATRELLDEVADILPGGELRLGFDDARVTVAQHRRLTESLPAGVELVPAAGVVQRLRLVKEPAEIDAIAATAELADASLEWLLGTGLIGRTEREIALALEHDMRERGASGPSFSTIVAAGAHGALPHATPRTVKIEPGQLVTIDFGAVLDGYCSDCTRTFATGAIGAEAEAIYELTLRAQLASLDAVKAGPSGREVDAVAREIITEAGHGDHFGHGLGHGVGLEVHEGPRLSPRASDEPLQTGSIVTVEPGVYLPGSCGVRIEDLVVVEDAGCRILTGIPKTLRVVD